MHLSVLLSIFGCQRTLPGLVKKTKGRVEPRVGGDSRDRTDDLRLAKPALSQLSYIPAQPMVGLARFELATSRLSGVRSNQLSYRPNIPVAGPRSSLWQENSVRGLEQSVYLRSSSKAGGPYSLERR